MPEPSMRLPDAVARAIEAPEAIPGARRSVEAAGHRWHVRAWGDPTAAPFLLVHGVTSDSGTFWRLGPALAAAGRHAIAIDLPGHGATGGWRGRHRFVHTATDLAEAAQALGIAGSPELAVLGHSWGGMVVAALPAAGLVPRTLILLDPPALPVAALEAMTRDPEEQPLASADAEAAAARLHAAHPDWHPHDARVKADGLARFEREAVRAVLFDNGDWDAGLAGLAHPAARDADVWLIRGEWGRGGLIPDAALPALHARLGADHVVTIPGAPHSPQRTHLEATVEAILHALGASSSQA